ncbi:MAG: hypothetical protein M1827_007750 [Pycnora praestabilis]|nr:MAG: hypothetical protein M1827_007750 [Pycnora praestabilis]
MTGYAASRPAILSIAKVSLIAIANLPLLRAAPLGFFPSIKITEDEPKDAEDPTLWIYLAVAVVLVLLGGVFAGLTIALMGQDEIYLQVIHTSGEGAERKHAGKVLRLLKRGKHWVLVTLLLGNVITNETLPIVLDRSLGGGWPAVLGSTVAIVIFGEIIPQSICVRYGLPIGAWMSPLVLVLMYILAPVAWPTAKLLDRILGEDHGTTYKKAGLKSLVTLHKTLGSTPGERLNQDEVTIISAVLDLKDKPIGSIMTPMEDVFTMSGDTVLDEKTVDIILSAGYSRIPIYEPGSPQNFVGMLLVKILITYDPEDGKRVSEFALATLPETEPITSCLDIVNFFQEGKSHMVLVSDHPGTSHGALGVVTLEDVIEELIGEEIIDESDVSPEAARKIRRLAPGMKSRMVKGPVVTDLDTNKGAGEEQTPVKIDNEQNQSNTEGTLHRVASHGSKDNNSKHKPSISEFGTSPKAAFMRRISSYDGSSDRQSLQKRGPEMREHRHLGPSNLASRPKTTRYNTVKIKPYGGGIDVAPRQPNDGTPRNGSISTPTAYQGGVGEGLLDSAGKDAKDGVQAVQAGYGTMDKTPPRTATPKGQGSKGIQEDDESEERQGRSPSPKAKSPEKDARPKPAERQDSAASHSTIGSLQSGSRPPNDRNSKRVARSGSITATHVETGGVKKMVLEATSSSDTEGAGNGQTDDASDRKENNKPNEGEGASGSGNRKKRRRKKKPSGGKNGEETPLLDKKD